MTAGSGCGLSLFVFPKEHVAEKKSEDFLYTLEKSCAIIRLSRKRRTGKKE